MRLRIILRSSSVYALLVLAAPGRGVAGSDAGGEVLESLRAANEARAEDAREREAWSHEKERLRLLERTIAEQIAQLEATEAEHRRALSSAEEQIAALGPKRARRAALERFLASEADRIDLVLSRAMEAIPPGVIAKPKAASADPAERFLDALHRLETAEKRAREVAIEIATGRTPDGEERSVELLRAGGVAAWWRSLDGESAGPAVPGASGLVLEAAPPDEARAIADAIEIAKGRRTPALVQLSLAHAKKAAAGSIPGGEEEKAP